MLRHCSFLFLALLVSTTAAAATEPLPPVAFAYVRDGAEDCPDEDEIRRAVAGRLGVSPFAELAQIFVSVTVHRAVDAFEAHIAVRDVEGKTRGQRQLRSTATDCRELAESMILTLSIAIDPLLTAAVKVAEKKADPPPSLPPPLPPPAEIPIIPIASIGLGAVFGSAPATAAIVSVSAGAKRGAWSLSIEGRAALPASMAYGDGRVGASLLQGALVPCVERGGFGGCVLAAAGARTSSAEGLPQVREVVTPALSMGARAFLSQSLVDTLVVRLHLEVLLPITRTGIFVGATRAWSEPPVAVAAGLSLTIAFP